MKTLFLQLTVNESQLAIPVEHGFDIWNTYSTTNTMPTAEEVASGKVLDLATVNNLEGELSVKVVWQEDRYNSEEPQVISSVSIYKPEGISHISKAQIIVEAGKNLGNALIAAHIGPTGTDQDPVLWHWRIWIPEDEPQALPAAGKWTFMDRYLGAINNGPKDYNESDPTTRDAHGLYYEFGRPMPLKRFEKGWTYESAVYPSKDDSAERTNLTLAIQSPAYLGHYPGNYVTQDWYSNISEQDAYGYDENNPPRWLTRWGNLPEESITPKTLLDPCPEGWRVPPFIDGVSPWDAISREEGKADAEMVANQGFFFNTTKGYNYYAASSFGSPFVVLGGFSEGKYRRGDGGATWSGSAFLPEGDGTKMMRGVSMMFRASDEEFSPPKTNLLGAAKASVRCVKE